MKRKTRHRVLIFLLIVVLLVIGYRRMMRKGDAAPGTGGPSAMPATPGAPGSP